MRTLKQADQAIYGYKNGNVTINNGKNMAIARNPAKGVFSALSLGIVTATLVTYPVP
ncbi:MULTISPECIES: hypothetical protein [Salinivibrio]|jgi:hypothetical protein|uniref:hypothetical protein n=1 Tax=Salinivibrio TaxID=51366 RepID=UPI0013016840|nr:MULTISPECIES: hypothetical protein [unclassified Salinivibrio]